MSDCTPDKLGFQTGTTLLAGLCHFSTVLFGTVFLFFFFSFSLLLAIVFLVVVVEVVAWEVFGGGGGMGDSAPDKLSFADILQ